MSDEKPKSNLRALVPFRLKGKLVEKGEVVSKEKFAKKGDWQNLLHMKPARVEEVSAAVGKPKAAPKLPEPGK